MPWPTAKATVGVSREHTQRLVYSLASIRHINAVVLDMGAQQHSRYILYSLVPYVISFLLFCKTRTVQVRSLVAFLWTLQSHRPLPVLQMRACERVCWCSG